MFCHLVSPFLFSLLYQTSLDSFSDIARFLPDESTLSFSLDSRRRQFFNDAILPLLENHPKKPAILIIERFSYSRAIDDKFARGYFVSQFDNFQENRRFRNIRIVVKRQRDVREIRRGKLGGKKEGMGPSYFPSRHFAPVGIRDLFTD